MQADVHLKEKKGKKKEHNQGMIHEMFPEIVGCREKGTTPGRGVTRM